MTIRLDLTRHAKQRLFERFGLTKLPQLRPVFIRSQSCSRKLYRIGDIQFIWNKDKKKVVTILPRR